MNFRCVKLFFLLLPFLSGLPVFAQEGLELSPKNFVIVLSESEGAPVRRAVKALTEDFGKVTGYSPETVSSVSASGGRIAIVIVNGDNPEQPVDRSELRTTDGFESHRVYCDPARRRIYLHGSDTRGTIYAIYTFSEKFLGVPPLWYFCSWEPMKKSTVKIAPNYDYHMPSPQVRYRAWFPNDQDMYIPWRKISQRNDEILYETMLRLKLNTIEVEATVSYPDRMTPSALLIADYGLVITSHHMIALNNSWRGWDDYWRRMRHTEPPKLSLANVEAMKEFWEYNARTVYDSGVENLWLIAFRGAGDAPFWSLFEDAPQTDRERGEVITNMLRMQYDIIKKVTGEEKPFVRITFYDEMSDLMSAGHVRPPAAEHVIWTFVAARRDHYPNSDLVNLDPAGGITLGYYMNLQFTSTGAHLAQAEGPWKMEANYRYVNSKAPLYFSVVNSGNQREFLLSLSANAALMWDMTRYDSDRFMDDFCARYFGDRYAGEVAKLYRDYFRSYWQQKAPDFEGFDRQYIFQDLRYARAFEQIASRFKSYTDNPLHDIGFERMQGRTFRIEGPNQVDSLIAGMAKSWPKFDNVARECRKLSDKLDPQHRRFFRDNLYAQTAFMGALSRSMFHFATAYKLQADRKEAARHLDRSVAALEEARDYLYSTQEGVFATWYTGDAENGKFNLPKTINLIKNVRDAIDTD